jgi:hypothetical protein
MGTLAEVLYDATERLKRVCPALSDLIIRVITEIYAVGNKFKGLVGDAGRWNVVVLRIYGVTI